MRNTYKKSCLFIILIFWVTSCSDNGFLLNDGSEQPDIEYNVDKNIFSLLVKKDS